MTLSNITTALFANRQLARQMSVEAWTADQQMRGEKVALFRQYADGDHRSYLTPEMRRLLRIVQSGTGSTSTLSEFNDNYMDVVIQTEADRLEVERIEVLSTDAPDPANSATPAAKEESVQTTALKEWVEDLLEDNRFDGMQMDTHEACLRDGDTFVLVDWDATKNATDRGRVRFTLEEAYDGTSGMLVMYDSPGKVGLAIKVWYVTGTQLADTCRVNVYYPDRIEKYIGSNGQQLTPYVEEGQTEHSQPWVMPNGEPIGVPVIHFANRGKDAGISEIENAIPLQDALNRTLISTIMTAELTAFQIRYAIGFDPPAGMTPGMWVKIHNGTSPSTEDVAWFNSIKIGAIQQGEIMPFLDTAKWLKGEISSITRTPAPEFMGDASASGEALKQREIGLLGKVRRFQVKAGNRWEDVIKLAHRVQTAYGAMKPPALVRASCKWQDAQIRNDTETVDNALKVADRVGEREFLRLVAPVFGYDEAKIEAILEEKKTQQGDKLKLIGGNFPTFNTFTTPTPASNGAANKTAVAGATNGSTVTHLPVQNGGQK